MTSSAKPQHDVDPVAPTMGAATGVGRVLRAIAATYRLRGLRGVLREAIGRIYERDDFVILRRDLRAPLPAPRCNHRFELRRLDDATLKGFKDMLHPFPRHYEYRFVHHQRRCYGAFVEGRIVALMWPLFQADNRAVVSRWRYLLADEARIGSIWADPAFRGTGLMAACLVSLAAYLRKHGFRYLYECTWIGNQAAIKLYRRVGFEIVGRAWRYAFRWQKEGHGFYVREPIPREPVPADHREGDLELPQIIPEP